MTTHWKPGRGRLGPLAPLIGDWVASTEAHGAPMRCTRSFTPFGKAAWIRLEAVWDMGDRGDYREVALFGPDEDKGLAFHSFTSDGKRSSGHLSDAGDVHPDAIGFEARMPAGLARMIYWPLEGERGFNFAVESRNKTGWNRFLVHQYRPAS